MRVGEAALHYFVDLDAEVFGGGDFASEGIYFFVKIAPSKRRQNLLFGETIQRCQVDRAPCNGVHRAAHQQLYFIVMAVTMRIIALAIKSAVFRIAQGRGVEPV